MRSIYINRILNFCILAGGFTFSVAASANHYNSYSFNTSGCRAKAGWQWQRVLHPSESSICDSSKVYVISSDNLNYGNIGHPFIGVNLTDGHRLHIALIPLKVKLS